MERKAQNAVPGVRTLEEKLLEALAESLKQVCATIRGRSDDILQPLRLTRSGPYRCTDDGKPHAEGAEREP